MNFPTSTYRLQINSKFTLADVKMLIEYLHKLGISTIYAAPITSAIHDSSHGYDVINPLLINPELGTFENLQEISELLKPLNMSWLQDIVPNHMAFTQHNIWLNDVLERGEHSPYYRYFDINWSYAATKGKILIPIIDKPLEESIEAGDIKLQFDKAGFSFTYFDNVLPISKSGLQFIHDLLLETVKPDDILIHQLQSLINHPNTANLQDWQHLKNELTSSIINDKDKARKLEIDQCVERINNDKKLLTQLMLSQHFVLTTWQSAEKEMNYRRFFTINCLICLRMEDENVFDDYHQLISQLHNEGLIQGVRIDHIDGLADPKQYVEKLRKLLGEDCYIIAEKILDANEDLAKDWALQGTSGYDFLSFTNRLLTDKAGAEKLLTHYHQFVPFTKPYKELVYENKYNFLQSQMAGELNNLVGYLQELNLFTSAFDTDRVKKALGIFMACFPIYRIYPEQFPLAKADRQLVDNALEAAAHRDESMEWELKFIKSLFDKSFDPNLSDNKLKFIKRLMQFTGPLAAKGVEDTTFYVYNPLISHNEVGDSPAELSMGIHEFHNRMIARQLNNPYSLNATSTHDTKRGEDARMRINVLAELADEWKTLVAQWQAINQAFIQTQNGKAVPSANDQWFIYQSLIGSFPEDLKVTESFVERTKGFIIKALREAKVETTYSAPNTTYEHTCVLFIDRILKKNHPFIYSFIPFLQKVIQSATVYSLVQTIIKNTAPGIPDIYQGSELWELSYVDPDNRRPVDYTFRADLLNSIISKSSQSLDLALNFIKEKREQGAEKLFVNWKTLHLRHDMQDVFLLGHYIPLQVSTLFPEGSNKIIAYARCFGTKWIIVVLPLAIVSAFATENIWEDITVELPPEASQTWHNIFTDEILETANSVSASRLFAKFPVAVLRSIPVPLKEV